MSDDIKFNIRFYQPGDDESIVELLRKTFPKWDKMHDPLKFWRWKYIENPQKTLITIVLVDNKIVGFHHSIYYKAKLGSEIECMGYTDDLVIDPDYRGLGLWGKIRDYKNRVIGTTLNKYSFSTTANPIVINSWAHRNRGVFPFPVTRIVKINDIGFHLRMRPIKNRILVKHSYSSLKKLGTISHKFSSSRIKRVGEFDVAKVPQFDEKIDYFWEKIKDDYNFILEKKHPYLNWRFIDNEKGSHIKVQAMNGDEVLGYAVFGLKEEEGYTEGLVEDLVALKDRLDVVDALLDYGCKYFDDLGVNAVYYQVVEGHPYQRFSVRKGFLDSRSKPYISFEYTDLWKKTSGLESQDRPEFLKLTVPSQVYFNYAETV